MDISKEIAQELLNTYHSTKDFVLEQAPDVVQQLLTWKLASSLIWLGLCSLVFLAIGIYWRVVYKKWDTIYKKDLEAPVCIMGVSVTGVAGIFGGFLWVHNLQEALQLYFAPKVYLIEYLSNLVSGS